MTGEASRKARWPGGFCAVLMIYSPGFIAKPVLDSTIKTHAGKLRQSKPPPTHPPTHLDVRAPPLRTSGLGLLASVSYDGYGAFPSRGQVDLSMTYTTLRNRSQNQ